MGGGDLNMKKSWHPLVQSNQERVWKRQQEVAAEEKRVQELQKERQQERAVQELQRLQAEAGGGTAREARVEWMYAAPAQGNGPNAEELEQYLLGKKRVDKLLKGNEEKMLEQGASAGAAGGQFTAIQNANTSRDTAAKIREDPLLAIKRQEQLQYEKMVKQAAREGRSLGPAPHPTERKSKKDETREERRVRKEAKRRAEEGGSSSRDEGRHASSSSRRDDRVRRERSRSPRRSSHSDDRRRDGYRRNDDRDRRRDDRDFGRDDRRDERYDDRREHDYRPSHSSRARSRSPPPPPREDYNNRSSYSGTPSSRPPYDNRDRYSGPSSSSYDRPPPSSRPPPPAASAPAPPKMDEAARKAEIERRLAAMQSDAASLHVDRGARLKESDERAREDELIEAEKRRRDRGVGPSFMHSQNKQVFGGGMDLAERMKRNGRVGVIQDAN